MDYAALKNEITNDPLNLGYAVFVTAGNDEAIAAVLNMATGPGPGAATVTMSAMPRDDFMLAITPSLISLPGLSATIQSKWDRILAVVRSATSINLAQPSIQALLGAAVADGVLTSDQVAVIGKRAGSRAEVLFGAGTNITNNDISFALRGAR